MAFFIRGIWALLAFTTTVGAICNRATLHEAARRYVATQSLGQVRYLDALTSGNITYVENGVPKDLKTGILSTPLKIDHTRSTYDITECASYTEIIVTDPKHPYVIGTQIHLSNATRIGKIDTIVTDAGDWLFFANHTLHYVLLEDWAEIPESKRDTRTTIQAAADAYLDLFNNKSVVVPWGVPCHRLEGGLYTQPNDTCATGVPSGVPITERRYVIDETLGTVDVFSFFGGSRLPDTHEFRVEGGEIRYVHTMTVCVEANCGMDVPAILNVDPGY